jgi:chromosomal replication initiator protein
MTSPQEIWQAVLGRLQVQVSKPNYDTWLKNTEGVSYDNEQFVVGTPNTFIAEWLESRILPQIENALGNIIGKMVEVHFLIQTASKVNAPVLETRDGGLSFKETRTMKHNLLNPKFTFDTFVTGKSNELAFSAAYEVSLKPGISHNPLFIYSGTGLGKTHLIQAIGNSVKAQSKRVMYTNPELLTNEYVNAIKNKKADEFNEKYRSYDVLLLDDFQFFSGKRGTQQCFYHLFNDFQANERQIVITCDSAPRDITELGERLRSRLEGGLVADIKPPDFETRMAILGGKARVYKMNVSEDVLRLVATHLCGNIRELEGGLNRIVTFARLNNSSPDKEMASKALLSIVGKESDLENTSARSSNRTIEVVAQHYGLAPDALTGKQRDRNTTLARQTAMYLLREHSHYRLNEIGKMFGGRDHTTVMYSCEKVAAEMGGNQQLNQSIQTILDKLNIHKNPKG